MYFLSVMGLWAVSDGGPGTDALICFFTLWENKKGRSGRAGHTVGAQTMLAGGGLQGSR